MKTWQENVKDGELPIQPGQNLLTEMGWDYWETESAARRVAEFAEEKLREKNEKLVALDNHARFTISTLEKFLKNRGETTGLKKWEQELLVSSYRAAKMPEKDWKFGLSEGKKVNYICPWDIKYRILEKDKENG